MPASIDLATATVAQFEPLLREKFAVSPPVGSRLPSFELELVRVAPYHLGGAEGQRAPFSLFFQGLAGMDLGQGIYPINHPRTGEIPLFLVPVARQEERVQLEAVLS